MLDAKNEPVRPRGVDCARVISVIETKAIRGLGVEEDPVRQVIQYWSMEGKLLAEKDEFRTCLYCDLRKVYEKNV